MWYRISQRGWQWLAALSIFFAASHAWGAPQHVYVQPAPPKPPLPAVSPDYRISVYASVPEPMKLSFAPDGSLYVGRQPGLRIHRVAPGGLGVSEFGPPMVDPDAVLVDTAGRISGRRNSVLVGGGGVLAAIFPDQTSSVIFNTGFDDVDDMKFDRHGRLIFADDRPLILSSSGKPPTVLFSIPERSGSIAIDRRNRIFVASGSAIRIYNPDGTLADDAFATGLAGLNTYIAFANEPDSNRDQHRHAQPDTSLYVLNGTTLLRFDRRGQATTIGTGFVPGPGSGTGFVFGPDNALYVSDYDGNRILRIARRDRHQGHRPE
jgi:hypothetical protein